MRRFPIRESLNVLQEDLNAMWTQSYGKKRQPTELEKLLEKGGGLFRSTGKNSVIFNVYTDVHHAQLSTRPQGFAIGLNIRCPPGLDEKGRLLEDRWKQEIVFRLPRRVGSRVQGFIYGLLGKPCIVRRRHR